jgi:hypothetical protein
MVVRTDTISTRSKEGMNPDKDMACGMTRTPHATKTRKMLQNIRNFCLIKNEIDNLLWFMVGGRLMSDSRKVVMSTLSFIFMDFNE